MQEGMYTTYSYAVSDFLLCFAMCCERFPPLYIHAVLETRVQETDSETLIGTGHASHHPDPTSRHITFLPWLSCPGVSGCSDQAWVTAHATDSSSPVSSRP